MRLRLPFKAALLGAMHILAPGLPVRAQEAPWLAGYRAALYEGRNTDAAGIAQVQLAVSAGDPQAGFALGISRFVDAVNHLGQALYRYGLRSEYETGMSIVGAPFLRLPIPHNPNPQAVSYEGLREALAALVSDMEAAEAELARVGGPAQLPLDVARIRLDFDGNGAGDVPMRMVIETVTGLDDSRGASAGIVVDFDASDVLWLRAYCHLLAGMGDLLLGYDWKSGYDAAFYALFPSSDFPPSVLRDNNERLLARQAELQPLAEGPVKYQWDPGYAEWAATPQGQARIELDGLRNPIQYGGIADVIAFFHLMHWPVAEPERLAAVVTHLEAMSSLSRANWRSIQAETDDGREWIPNLSQHGALPGMRIDQARIDGWSKVLDQLDGIVAGRILIPHWRFVEGVNLRRFLLEPTPFDPVLLFTGEGAGPYLEKGTKADPATWNNIARVFGGDFLRYFLWIN